MHTTPAPPVDVSVVVPALAPYARTTVRLHPRRGTPGAEQSSMGGPLLWPVDEVWPTCDGPEGGDHDYRGPGEAEAPLVPVLQLLAEDFPEIPFPAGADVLQVLWCPFDHEPWTSPRPTLRWRRRAAIGPIRATTPAPDTESDPQRVPDPCVLDPERVIEYPSWDLPDELFPMVQDIVADWGYEDDLSVASGTKVGGYPGWTQFPDWPDCACGARMEHLLTVASWEFSRGDEKRWIALEDRLAMADWDFDAPGYHPWRALQNPPGLMLGDVGGIYLFVCTTCPDRPADYRFDCS